MDALANLRYLTRHYRDLQGYRLLPFAAFFLVRAVHDFWAGLAHARYDGYNTGYTVWGLILMVGIVFAAFSSNRIGRWYEAHRGYIVPLSPPKRSHTILLLLLVLLVLGAFVFGPILKNYFIIFGLAIMVQRLWETFPDVRHVPQSVVWVAFGLNFSVNSLAISFGFIGRPVFPPPGLNSAVVLDLIAATMLFMVAIYNHRTLEQLSAAREAVGEEAR